MPERIDVFISSTSRDLKKYREKVKDTVLNAGAFPIAMEEFDATERSALQKCYDEVCKAEIFIGIYAHRYGFAPGADMSYVAEDGAALSGDDATSITAWEYRWALERHLPMLLYVVGETDDEGEPLPWATAYIDGEPERSRLAAFKAAMMGSHVVGFFQSPDDLARQVAGALPKLLTRFEDAEPALVGRRDFYRHVNLPANFVARPELLADLRTALLAQPDGVALHGMGGIGKSVMARALCEDPDVQAAFPDGILWVSIGQDAREDDLKAKLRAWVETLGGGVGDTAPSIDRLKESLAGLLAKRACLLIVDDVWRRRDGDHFRVGGERCRLLVTTRDAEVAHALGVETVAIPLMTDAEAATLLDQWSGGALDGATAHMKRRIYAETLGRLPLAIRLAGAQLRGRTPADWLKAFDARRLAARRPESIHDSLGLTFGLSLDALHSDDRALYAALAIFKEDEPVSRSAVRRLWQTLGGLDAAAIDDLLVDLAARALLEIDEEDGASGAIILHDLLREFIRAELPAAARVHRALLDAYGGWGGWHAVADDGYLYAHLIYHLNGAGASDAIRALFLDDRWLNARVAADGYLYDGYVADLETAWFEIVEPAALRQIEAGEERFGAYVDLARLALIRTTINSLASNHVLELVARAVEIGLEGWTPDRALSIAKHVSSPISRAHWYARLLKSDRLTPEQRDAALHRGLGAAYNIYEPQYRAARLAALAGFLEGQERESVIHDMTATLDDVSESRAATFSGVIAVMSEAEGRTALLDRALREVMGIHHDKSLAESLISLAPLLDTDQLLRVLNVLSRFSNERYAVRLLENITARLPVVLLDAALEKIGALRYPAFRTRAYASMARRLASDDPRRSLCIERARDGLNAEMDWWVAVSAAAAFSTVAEGGERERILEQAVAMAESLTNARSRARAFVMLAEVLRPTDSYWVSLCVTQAKRLFIEDDTFAELLAALAGKVSTSDLRHLAVISAASIQDRRARADVYEAFAPFLSRDLLAELLSQAYGVHDERAQVEAVATLARALPVEDQEEVFTRALDTAETIRDPRVRSRAVAPFASSAPESLLPRVVTIALDDLDSGAGLKIVMGLAERLSDVLLPSALDVARRISDPGSSVEALSILCPWLTSDEQREVRRRAEAGGERTRRGMVYLALLDARAADSETERDVHIAEALAQARGIPSPVLRGWALVDIARIHRSPQVDVSITALYEECLTIRYEWSRASALAALSALLTPAQRMRALPVIHAMNDPWARAWALAAFSNLPDSGAAQVAEFRRFIVNYVRLRTDVKRESKLQFLAARLIYRAPTFDRETLAALTQVVIDVCWTWRWL